MKNTSPRGSGASAVARTTLGTGLILLGSMLYFTSLESRLVLHEILIGVFMAFSTPVTYMLLVRAALHRDLSEGRNPLGPSSGNHSGNQPDSG